MRNGISVIIPTFNRESFVAEAIKSVIEQDYDGEIEIIISDDGSTDDTVQIAASFGNKVKILRKPSNCTLQGASATRNRGISAVTKKYVCFLDSDDFYLPGHLKKMARVLDSSAEKGFCFCRTLKVKEMHNKKLFTPLTHRYVFKNDIKNPTVSRTLVVNTNSFMFRKEVFEKVGSFNEFFPNGEDGDLWMRISEHYPGSFSNHYGVVYRMNHGENQLTKNSKDQLKQCYLDIHENAICRYYQLKLKDKKRIFKLKYWVLSCKYRENTLIFYSKYLFLILHYPITFFTLMPVRFSEILENRKKRKWYELEFFI